SRAELQASNRTLAQEKRRIQAIVDNSPDGLLILSEDGSVGYANPAARGMLPWRERIGGNGAVPLEAALPPTMLRALGRVLKAIASDFLDLARIETGRLEIRREPVAVERVARRVLEELTPQARERGLWLRLAPPAGEVPPVLGDEARIAQIFTNLVHNGIKFT